MLRNGWRCLGAALTTLGILTTPALGSDVDPAEAFEVLVVDPVTINDLPATPEQPFMVDVVIEGEQHTLLLGPWNLRADGFQVWTVGDDGVPTPYQASAPLTVRGGSLQDPTIIVAGSLLADGLKVVITRMDADQVTWGLEPLRSVDPTAERAEHVLYRVDESLATGLCGNDNHNHAHAEGDDFGEVNGRVLLGTEIAHDADFQFYSLLSSNEQNVINDIENVMASVTAIYERDASVTYLSTDIIIRTSSASNPYTSNDAQTLLGQFRSHWLSNHASIQRDVAHLWTGRSVNGSTIGIAWTIGGICTSSAYCLSQSRFTGNFSSRVALTAHEIGHLYGAWHCNQNPNISNPCNIMCSGLGGCNGVGLPNFGPQSIDFITAHAASRNCLDEIPENLFPPIVDDFDGGGPPNNLIWESVTGATTTTTLAPNEPSGSRSLVFFGAGSITSLSSTFAGPESIYVGLWAAANNVNPGQAAVFEYFDNDTMQYEELIRFEPSESATTDSLFTYKVAALPESSYGSDARFRIRSTGGTQWYVDSMRIGDVVKHGLPFSDSVDGDGLSGAHWTLPSLAAVSGNRIEMSIFDSLVSKPIQGDYWLNDSRPLYLSFSVEQSGLPAGMTLIAEVSDGGGWAELFRVNAGDEGTSGPETVQGLVPPSLQADNMQIRLRTEGPVVFGTAFFVDDVLLGDEAVSEPPACTGDIADDFGTPGADGMVSFGDFLSLLGLVGPCPGGTPGCSGDIADDFGTVNGGDGQVSFGDFLALLGLVGPCP